MRPKGKFGLRSGNTFHFGGRRSATTLRHSCDQHVVVKTIINDATTDVDLRQFTRREAEQLAGPRNDRTRLVALVSRQVLLVVHTEH